MSRPLSVSSLRSALPSIRPFQPTFLPQAPASSSSFSTTSPALASRTRILAKRKKAAHIAKRAALLAARNAGTPDHILGYVIPDAGPSRVPTPPKSPWDGCRLQRTLLRPDAVYSTPAPDYPSGASPGQYLPGLSKADQDILFGALPHAATELALFGASEENHTQRVAVLEGVEGEQRKRTEMLQRILDLRNASKKGIEVVNRQRVIEEFGRKADGKGMDTGSSQVQAALLTQKIRSLAEHLNSNPRDNSNMRALRMLVHHRARVLKYFKRTSPEGEYDTLLADLGLERRAVEGELTF